MSDQLNLHMPLIIEIAYEIVVLPVSRHMLPVEVTIKEEIKHDFIPDRRLFTFRLLGKPSLGQSPPASNAE